MLEQTIKEQLADAIDYDAPLLAHAIYFALQEGIVQLDDPASSLPKNLDYDIVTKWRDENVLQLCTIKLFTIPMGQNRHALYLAKKEDDARAKHFKIYAQLAQRILDATHKMDVSLYCEATGRYRMIRELKRQVLVFPCYLGEVGR